MANPMFGTKSVQSGRYSVKLVDAKSRSAVISNLAGAGSAISRAAPEEVRRATGRVRRRAQSTAPVGKTGMLRDNHIEQYSDGGLVGTVLVDPEAFAARGLTYYPAFVHNGTTRIPPNPWLRRAGEAEFVPFQRRMVKGTQKALKENARA